MVLLLQMEGKCSSRCQDTEDARGMPMTNLSLCQGDFLGDCAALQQAASSHSGLSGHREEKEEEQGKHCKHAGESVKGPAMHSLGAPQLGSRGSLPLLWL